jgi:hypothetical protein
LRGFYARTVPLETTETRYFCPLPCPRLKKSCKVYQNFEKTGAVMGLTDTEIKKLKPTGKDYQKAEQVLAR